LGRVAVNDVAVVGGVRVVGGEHLPGNSHREALLRTRLKKLRTPPDRGRPLTRH
jgi:hypothetical protein